jgi:hypothetical protein
MRLDASPGAAEPPQLDNSTAAGAGSTLSVTLCEGPALLQPAPAGNCQQGMWACGLDCVLDCEEMLMSYRCHLITAADVCHNQIFKCLTGCMS